jgi:hypothetical protein
MYEKRALMRIFGSMKDEIIRCWIKLYNEELHNLCSSPNTYNYNAEAKKDEMGRVYRMQGV